MAGHDANTLVQLADEPNVLADRHRIEPGLVVSGQNYRGSLAYDRGASLRLFGRFLPVGFYYRAFHRPKGAWKRWEPIIRSFAGLGKVNLSAAHRYYDKAYGFYDLVVVGGGPAGMSAALEAAVTASRSCWSRSFRSSADRSPTPASAPSRRERSRSMAGWSPRSRRARTSPSTRMPCATVCSPTTSCR